MKNILLVDAEAIKSSHNNYEIMVTKISVDSKIYTISELSESRIKGLYNKNLIKITDNLSLKVAIINKDGQIAKITQVQSYFNGKYLEATKLSKTIAKLLTIHPVILEI